MNDSKFSYLLIDQPEQENLNLLKKKKISNKDIYLQKFEKFKPKEKSLEYGNIILEKRENQVKNLLSGFLKNLKSDRNDSDILKEEKINHKKINIINSNKDKIEIKNNFIGDNTDNIKPNSDINNIIFPQEKKKNNININFNCYHSNTGKNIYSIKERNNSFRKKNIENNFKTDRSSKFKEKINNIIKQAKSFGLKFITKYKSDDIEKNSHKIKKIINSNKKQNYDSLIKKNKSFQKDNNYINLKNNLNKLDRNSNDNFSLRPTNKKTDKFLKMFKKTKSDMFNESNHNSILSDLSNIHLNKKSFDINDNYKVNDFKIKEKKSKSSLNNQNLSNRTNPLIFSTIKESYKLSESSQNSSKIKSTINPEKASNLKKLMNLQKDKDDFKKYDTTNLNKKRKFRKNNNISKALRTDAKFKILKEQLKHSIILRPEKLKLSSRYLKTSKNNEKKDNSVRVNKKHYLLKNRKESNELGKKISNSFKSIDFGLKKDSNNCLKNESNFNKRNEESKLLSEKGLSEKVESKESKDSIANYSFNKDTKRKNIHNPDKFRKILHKSNLYDSLDDEEFEDEEDINSLYIDPNSLFSITFDSILFCFSIISFIEIPLFLAMSHNFCRDIKISFIALINYIIDIINIIDLFLSFFRAYYNWEEQLIIKIKFIVLHYLSGWFFFDLLSSIPVYTIIKFHENECKQNLSSFYNVILNNVHYLFMFNKVFKILKVFWNNQAWKIFSNKINEKWNIIIIIFLVLSSINYTACMYIFIGRNSFPNWIFQAKLNSEPFINIYISAIYIITMALTTVGYGDITCYSFYERIVQLLILNIGIFGYSWVVSFISNYIKKINEKSADFDKKLSILDEIKRNNPNLPDDLYDRILRHLKFKNFYDKKLKNIIFDCLPVGLKNNLISEMYKPIIKNFIFFKNFQNTDFIVRVILAFKPIIAYKNDILVNEGDMIEDIMFVKKGVLALELVINMDNPQENINKYKVENINSNLESNRNSIITQEKSNNLGNLLNINKETDFNINNFNKSSSNLENDYFMKYTNSLNKIFSQKEKEKTELKKNKNLIYVKIVKIRENEHFGDVLMFLERKSPLRVRVRSIKCELLFLKKMDAIKIFASYQNLWKRINKKSVYNFEQMQKSINKIVEIYCTVKKNKPKKKSKILKEDDMNKKKMEKEKINKTNNDNLVIYTSNKIEKRNLKKRKSFQNNKINYENFFRNLEYKEKLNDIDNNLKKNSSMKKIEVHYNNINNLSNLIFSSSSLSSISSKLLHSSLSNKNNISNKKSKKENICNNNNQKENKYFERNDKFQQGITQDNNEDKKKSKITEEENSFSLPKEKSIKQISQNSSNKNKKYLYTEKNNSNSDSHNNEEESMKRDGNENDSNSSNIQEINEELKSGEVIKIYNNETLLCKKIGFDILSTKQENSELNNSLAFKNSKVKILLKFLEGKNDKMAIKNKYTNINNENQNKNSSSKEKFKNKFESNKNNILNFGSSSIDNESNKNLESSIIYNDDEKKSKTWKNNLFINNNNSFQINSSYENFNLISHYKLVRNKLLQKKMKEYLINEIINLPHLSIKSTKLAEKLTSENKKEKNNNKKDIKNSFALKKNRDSISNINNISSINRRSKTSKIVNFSLSINKNPTNLKKLNTRRNLPQIKFSSQSKLKRCPSQKEIVIQNIKSSTNITNNFNYFGNTLFDFQKKMRIKKNSTLISPLKLKKKKDSIISKINFNIQKTNQNLNNPDEFYSNYFNSIILGELNQKKNNKKENLYSPPNHKLK